MPPGCIDLFCAWSHNNLQGAALSYHVRPRDQTQVERLGDKPFYMSRNLSGPAAAFEEGTPRPVRTPAYNPSGLTGSTNWALVDSLACLFKSRWKVPRTIPHCPQEHMLRSTSIWLRQTSGKISRRAQWRFRTTNTPENHR